MKPLVGVIHELPLPTVLAIANLMNHTPIQQRPNGTIARTTEVNTKAIADLTLEMRTGFSGIREEMRVGFANVDTKFADVKGDIRELRSEIKAIDGKFDEKTKNLDPIVRLKSAKPD